MIKRLRVLSSFEKGQPVALYWDEDEFYAGVISIYSPSSLEIKMNFGGFEIVEKVDYHLVIPLKQELESDRAYTKGQIAKVRLVTKKVKEPTAKEETVNDGRKPIKETFGSKKYKFLVIPDLVDKPTEWFVYIDEPLLIEVKVTVGSGKSEKEAVANAKQKMISYLEKTGKDFDSLIDTQLSYQKKEKLFDGAIKDLVSANYGYPSKPALLQEVIKGLQLNDVEFEVAKKLVNHFMFEPVRISSMVGNFAGNTVQILNMEHGDTKEDITHMFQRAISNYLSDSNLIYKVIMSEHFQTNFGKERNYAGNPDCIQARLNTLMWKILEENKDQLLTLL